jgi:hypothetical protein
VREKPRKLTQTEITKINYLKNKSETSYKNISLEKKHPKMFILAKNKAHTTPG